ncbi:MAG: sulfatase-like hydrolase/transferase [Gemmatimonadaceae bacterium]|nr:sulfatase-like hydrolase/transferase [Gemmatimonadaceae bacterium]
MLLRSESRTSPEGSNALWRARLAVLLYAGAIAFPGVVSLAIKRKLLADEGGGYDLVAWALGLADGTHLGALRQVALYRWDLAVVLVALPIGWLLFIRWLAPGLRAALTALTAMLLAVALFIELKCFWEVGTFLPLHVLAAGALGAGRKFASEYLQKGSLIKLGAVLMSVVVATALAWWLERGARASTRAFPGWRLSTIPLAAAGLFVALPIVPRTPYDRSAAVMALGEFVGRGSNQVPERSKGQIAVGELVAQYREVSRAPVPNGRSPYFGKAKGYNVLVYLYETLPFACYHDSATASSYRALRSLEPSAFVAERHYATYPYSRRAYFSIYAGWYPPHGMRDFTDETWDDVNSLGSAGMVRSARDAGYQTAAYVPEHAESWESDIVRYRVLGFERHVVPPNAGTVTVALRNAPDARLGWQRPQDDSARALLKRDIRRASAAGKPWFFAFNPQLSHGPWPNASTAASAADACARGADVQGEVDRGLGEVLSLLDSLGQRKHTIVVALGDHGLRNRAEFPLFRGATLDDITFHVPMLISAPGVLDSTTAIPWPTSHVDIAPSVLDLLGIEAGRQMEQGSPMWTPALRDRRVFIFAQGYLGVDGYVEADRAVMLNYMLGSVSESRGPKLEFSPKQLLQARDSTSEAVTALLWRVTQIQDGFMQHLPSLSAEAQRRTPREAAGTLANPGSR